MNKLLEMLTYRRPMGSDTEQEFCERYIAPTGAEQDEFGNWVLRLGDAPVLWSSHTDTVHRVEGRQRLHVDKAMGMVQLSRRAKRKSNCLGADCTVGVWIMLGMVEAGVDGLYVWHYGEERGCVGSGSIADHAPELLTGIDYAIAFDRRGDNSVITHQGFGRSCSEQFASGLASLLGPPYKPDDTGMYTDTASYVPLVPECTNISVGFKGEHSQHETLDMDHARSLLEAMCEIDITQIGVHRDVSDTDDFMGYDWPPAVRGQYIDGGQQLLIWPPANYKSGKRTPEQTARILSCLNDMDGLHEDDVLNWVERNHGEAEKLLAEMGF